ncbi:MAG: hypothetical protein AAGB13_07385 [Cyanobacteria bacterium P01_F01_bin.33]
MAIYIDFFRELVENPSIFLLIFGIFLTSIAIFSPIKIKKISVNVVGSKFYFALFFGTSAILLSLVSLLNIDFDRGLNQISTLNQDGTESVEIPEIIKPVTKNAVKASAEKLHQICPLSSNGTESILISQSATAAFKEALKNATEIWLVGQSLDYTLGTMFLADLEQALEKEPKAVVKILIMKDEGDHLAFSGFYKEPRVGINKTKEKLSYTWESIRLLKRNTSDIEAREIAHPIPFNVVVLDPRKNSCMSVKLYGFNNSLSRMYIGSKNLYEADAGGTLGGFYWASIQNLWNAADVKKVAYIVNE